jgi:hypothetical protein
VGRVGGVGGLWVREGNAEDKDKDKARKIRAG